MPFDPNFPPNNAEIESLPFRNQFNSIKDLIDAAPGITGVVVDGVTTVPAGSAAGVTLNLSGTVLHFTFEIPQGADGPQGQTGSDGGVGPVGPQGPPFANVVIDSVTTLNPGEQATVSVSFDGTTEHLTFGIPQGAQGLPGEVTTGQMDTAIAQAITSTASNPTSVSPMNISFSDPPTQGELMQVQDKYNELLAALFRTP